MNKFLFLPLTLLVASCGGNDEVASGTFDDGEGGKGTYTVNQDDDATETVIKSGDSEVRFASGEKAANNLPMGLKLYPGAKIQSSMSGQGEGSSGAMVTFQTSADQDDVIAFYKKQVESKGLDIKAEINTGAMKMISAANDESEGGVNISVTKDGSDGTNVTVIAGGKD